MERGRWQGMLLIARFNWPFYAGAGGLVLLSLGILVSVPTFPIRLACAFVLAGTSYLIFFSLAVSHQVYDRSDLYRWNWIETALAEVDRGRMVLCHCGFDEVSAALRARLRQTKWIVLDHFDASRMTEPSIQRARRLFPPAAETQAAAFDRWPIETGTVDVVWGLLAIHELRSEAERTAWFVEARRCLRPNGRIILAEHVRDLPNLIAFGPGFLHFHSARSWERCWQKAGMQLLRELRPSWWVRVFVLGK